MTTFDKILWRTNGLLILTVALIGICGAALIAIKKFRYYTRTREVENIVTVNPQTQKKEYFTMGNLERTRGTNSYRASLYSKEDIDRSSYSKSSSSVRNTYIYNHDNRSNEWLFPSNDQIIYSESEIYDSLDSNSERKVTAYIVISIEKDSDSDGKLTNSDLLRIYITGPMDNKRKLIASNLVDISRIYQHSPTEIIFTAKEGAKDFIYHVESPSGEIKSKEPITPPAG